MSKKSLSARELHAKKPYFVNGVKFTNFADALVYIRAIGGRITDTTWKPYAVFLSVSDDHLKIA